MKMKMGVWIDYQQAVIVSLLGEKVGIKRIRSHADRHLRYIDPRTDTADDDGADNAREIYLENHKQGYYDAVLQHLRTADAILIFGPSETKTDLQKRLLQHQMSGRIVGVQTIDNLSTREFVAKVQQQFGAMNQQAASQDA